jgi:hypothetical protein
MKKMPAYTLKFTKSEGCWNTYDARGRNVGCYDTKSQGMKPRELRKIVGKAGGTVTIMSKSGKKVGKRSYPAKK